MNRSLTRSFAGALALAALTGGTLAARAQNAYTDPNFANSVVSFSGLGSNSLYNDPTAALGQPSTQIYGGQDVPKGEYHVSMAYPPYYQDQKTDGKNVIVTLGTGNETVAFNTPITHSDQHWYGDDFILFGNTFFPGTLGVTPTTDMTKDKIGGTGGIYQNGTPTVSVSSDGVTFYRLTPTSPYYPTNPYKWVGISAANPSGWDDTPGDLNDFTKPMNPSLYQPGSGDTSLKVAAFAGQTVAYAANSLYDDSAGGAAFSLAGLTDASGSPVGSISYIRFTGTGSSSVIDAVSRVGFDPAAAPEPGVLSVFILGTTGIAALVIRRRSRVNAVS